MSDAAAAAAAAAAQECLKLKAQFGPDVDCTTALTLLSVGHLDFMSPYERHMLCVYQIIAVLCFTLIISEYLNFLPREIWLIRKSRLSSGIVALLINRYSGLMGTITGAILSFANPSSCKATGWLFTLTFAIQQGAATYIFLLRTRAIWNNSKIITIVMGFGCFLVAGSFVATAFSIQYTDVPAELTPYGGRCLVGVSVERWRVASSITAATYDTVTLILTIIGLMGYAVDTGASKKIHRTVRKLAEASLWYFIPVVAVNISTVIIVFTTNKDIRAIAMAYSGTVAVIAASRMVFDLHSDFGVRNRGDAGMTYPSCSESAATQQEKLMFSLEDSNDSRLKGSDPNHLDLETSPASNDMVLLPYTPEQRNSPLTDMPFTQEQVVSYSASDHPLERGEGRSERRSGGSTTT